MYSVTKGQYQAALAVLADKAKRISRHLVMGCVNPLDADFGPYDIPTDRETIYDHALNGYGFIGRKAGDIINAGKTMNVFPALTAFQMNTRRFARLC